MKTVLFVKGSESMKSTQIKLQAPEEVKEFVNAATLCDFDIDVSYNSIIVDAKSFLGVLSLDLSRALTVACMGYDPTFDNTLKKYSLA